jgi:hypothetical protein
MNADIKAKSHYMNLIVDNVPYEIRVTPFEYNGQKRFRIALNGGDEYVYAWDHETVSLHSLDDASAILPDSLEKAISDGLVKTILPVNW